MNSDKMYDTEASDRVQRQKDRSKRTFCPLPSARVIVRLLKLLIIKFKLLIIKFSLYIQLLKTKIAK